MITWGISSESHNAALSVFVFDTLLFASESERFSGIKNDPQLNDGIISHALQYGKPSRVCWYENPYKKQVRQLLAGQGWQENFKNISTRRYIIATIIILTLALVSSPAGIMILLLLLLTL